MDKDIFSFDQIACLYSCSRRFLSFHQI